MELAAFSKGVSGQWGEGAVVVLGDMFRDAVSCLWIQCGGVGGAVCWFISF